MWDWWWVRCLHHWSSLFFPGNKNFSFSQLLPWENLLCKIGCVHIYVYRRLPYPAAVCWTPQLTHSYVGVCNLRDGVSAGAFGLWWSSSQPVAVDLSIKELRWPHLTAWESETVLRYLCRWGEVPAAALTKRSQKCKLGLFRERESRQRDIYFPYSPSLPSNHQPHFKNCFTQLWWWAS